MVGRFSLIHYHSTMANSITSFRPLCIGLTCGIAISTQQILHKSPIHLQSFPNPNNRTTSRGQPNLIPSPRKILRYLEVKHISQATSGSIFGLCAGLLLSTFSRPLVIILGLIGSGIQVCRST